MKKKNTLTNKKPLTMRTNQSSGNKIKKYIYTEADLGEGLLDAGVTYPYRLGEIEKTFSASISSNYIHDKKAVPTPTVYQEINNLREDFILFS